MPFSSVTDARDKITNPNVDESSLGRLWMSNRLFDLTTVFYTNEAKTILAPAGNVVIVTNQKTYYITLNSSGMMTSLPVYVMNSGFDTNWVDDKLYKGNTKVSNQGSVGGTNYVLSGYLLSDTVWSSRPYTNPKRWACNNGPINSTPMTNIDLSDMKGYDMIFYSGEWDGSKFVSYNFTYGVVHLAPDYADTGVVGNLRYFKRPDYWIPDQNFDAVSYFRRMPNMSRIKNKAGYEKLFTDMGVPYLDSVNIGTHTDRTSTILNKGLINRPQIYYQKNYGGTTLRTAKTPSIKFKFNPDEIFRQGIATAYGVPFSAVGFADPMWINRICAHLESLIVDDATWATGFSSYLDLSPSPPHTYIKYSDCNPYHWTTAWASGTGNYNQSMGGALEQFYYAWTDTIYAEQNAASVQWDFEYLPSAEYNENCGIAFKRMVDTCVSVIWDNPSIGGAQGAAKPKYSIYGGGIYNRAANGPGTSAWGDINAGNYLSSDLYSDYNNYYVNGTIPYTAMSGYKAWFKGAIDVFEAFYITNYQNKINETWYYYNLVHSYDISRKIITQIGVENGKDYSGKMICGYFWRYFEPVPSGTNVGFARQAYDYQDILRGDRPEVSPSMLQSLAVWSFAYADGLFLWDDSLIGEERQRLIDESVTYNTNLLTAEDTFLKYCGDTLMIGKGAHDWTYIGYLQVAQCQDIVEANTNWLVPDYYKSGAWTSGTGNYPVSLYANQVPLCRYKLNAAGTEALILIVSPFNNGYTKETHTIRFPAKSNYTVNVDTWGTYTSVIKITFP